MTAKLYTVGELAKLSGATIRTIQYYDKINLLAAKRDGKKNIRYYSKSDLMALQQILFYKRLGFPLKEIKNNLMNFDDAADIKQILTNQADILFQQEMETKMNLAIIEAVNASIEANPDQKLEPTIELVLSLNKQTILDYANIDFDEKTKELFDNKYDDYNEIIEIYWQWKQLILEAASYKLNSTHEEKQTRFQFGKKWHEFTENITADDPDGITPFEKGLEESDKWPQEDLFLYNFSKDFISDAYNYYLRKGDTSD
ncbi:MerR family transcriptional regulator [Virgibacillus sp. NKC19-16]|uniref:MerR family transcriptional regulator n=1 Tax=Virgibacillus salidurans TaxID=2831673 RepID=UPI001F1A36EB|nr:MerR family transcriptional regulator [Virgibacillus sp. NKC19-16]UJL45172.1 MerR family transcriptional regulator [Virgibacillus sp. NKC19-16]